MTRVAVTDQLPVTSFLSTNWNWLSAGALLTLVSSFGQTFFISIFAAEVRSEFDLSHGAWGGIYSIGTAASAMAMIWSGAMADRYRVRSLGAAVLVGLSIACLFMALNPLAALLPISIFLLRLTGQGMASHIAVVAMSRWFVATRGKALGIATLGFALGEAVLPITFVGLMLVVDWRWLWVAAALAALISARVLWSLLGDERTPSSLAEDDERTGLQNSHWTRQMVLRHPLFWYMFPAILGPAAFNTAFFFQQVHFAEVKGISHLTLVALFPIYTLFSILAAIGSGFALDRLGAARLMPWFHLPMVLAFVLFASGSGVAEIGIGLALMALTTGANSTLPSAFWAEVYGTRHLGAIKAMAAAVMVLGSAIGPGVTGMLIDADLGLEVQYLGVAVYFVLTTASMYFGMQTARR